MDWKFLTNEAELAQVIEQSGSRPQVIFKHSSRCGVSSMAKNRLEKKYNPVDIDFYFLDLITYRPLSKKIAEVFNVPHESPQVLLIKNGNCIYNESHSGITMDEIIEKSQAA